MDTYSFGTFNVEDYNRSAFEVCRDVANLDCGAPQPVVLTGDAGSGKTHLLYAIVNRVRASSPDAGIAYISANDFRNEVRNLVNNPAPVEDAEKAVLLVDSLESFAEDQEVLEAIVQIFLANGHYVVAATNVHPGRLQHLPDSLRQTLLDGETVTLLPSESTAFEPTESLSDELPQDDSLLLELRAELDSVRAAWGDAQEKLSTAESELEEMKGELDAAIAQESNTEEPEDRVGELESELEHLKGENALLAVAQKEIVPLREKLKRVQAERDKLEADLEIRPPASDENEPMSPRVLRDDARALLNRAEGLLSTMQKNRVDLTDAQQKQQNQLDEIRALEKKVHEPVGASAVIHALDAQISELCEVTDALRQCVIQMFKDTGFDSEDGRRWSSTSNCVELTKLLPTFAVHVRDTRIDLMEKLTESVDGLDKSQEDLEKAQHEIKHFSGLIKERDIMLEDLKSAISLLDAETSEELEEAQATIEQLTKDLEHHQERSAKLAQQHDDVAQTLMKLLSTMGHMTEMGITLQDRDDGDGNPEQIAPPSNITSFEEIAALAEAIESAEEPDDDVEEVENVESDDSDDLGAVEAYDADDYAYFDAETFVEPDLADETDPDNYSPPKSRPSLHHVEELDNGLAPLPEEEGDRDASGPKNQTA